MNYLQNKKQIMMAVCLIVSHTHYVSASDGYFPVGKRLFLDATSIPSWNNDYVYPYVYMFGNDGWNTWIKLRKQYCNSKYFTFRIPQGGYYGMVFPCNNCDVGSFEKCNQQTVDIYCDNNNNCYKFNGKYSEGKIIGDWHYLHENYFPAGQQNKFS